MQCFCNQSKAAETRRDILLRFIPLNLLLFDTKSLCKFTLRKPLCYSGLDEYSWQILESGRFENSDGTRFQSLIFSNLPSQCVFLALQCIQFGFGKSARSDTRGGLANIECLNSLSKMR